MRKNVTRLFREALSAGTASVRTLGEEAEYSTASFDLYRNRRAPSRDAILALSKALKRRADRLLKFSERLEEAAGGERDTDAAPEPRRRRACHRQRDR